MKKEAQYVGKGLNWLKNFTKPDYSRYINNINKEVSYVEGPG